MYQLIVVAIGVVFSLVIRLFRILLSAAIMDAWTRFFPQMVSSSIIGLWPVTVFLIGYAGESLLGEALELLRRKG
ncbi:MAG TPA: hypothetical protein VEL11_17545 [Candidatus Bathyarchaeia archaeon]|nr:hypothetical protein [Candidatus Bathyarchaeia archaeon]